VTEELREVWVCVGDGCGMRVSNASGRQIPEPPKWEDERCPLCRIDRAWKERGKEAADALAGRLLRSRRKPPRKQSGPSDRVVERRERVKEIVTQHPDLSNEQVAERIDGVTARQVWGDRVALDLPAAPRTTPVAPKPAAKPNGRTIKCTDEERAQIERELRETDDTDGVIAERVGVSKSSAASVRAELGIPSGTARRQAKKREAIAAVILSDPGRSVTRTATEAETSVPTVKAVYAELGIPEPVSRAAV